MIVTDDKAIRSLTSTGYQTSVLPDAAIRSLIRHRSLVYGLAKRDVLGRYRGSLLGLGWSFFAPALMLAVYTFFFGMVFKTRWPKMGDSNAEFALILFSGLIVFNLFSECVNRAPTLIVGNSNFVKRIIFPLDVLSWVNLLAGLFHFFVSLAVWVLFYTILIGLPHATILVLPVALVPLFLMLLGLGWLLSSLGVFLRDIAQVVGPVTVSMMFLSPIFYPLETLSGVMRTVVTLNPLTFSVEAVRGAMMWGEAILWSAWALQLLISAAFAALAFAVFQKTKKGFADVL